MSTPSYTVKLVFEKKETTKHGVKHTTPITYNLDVADQATIDFLFGIAEGIEKRAFALLDVAKAAHYDGDIDEMARAANEAKRINDHYLTVFAAIETIELSEGLA